MTKINIDDLTLGEIKQLSSFLNGKTSSKEHPFEIGKAYFIRTVTMTLVGKLEKVFDNELILSEASWVADSGRFNECLKYGLEKSTSSEVEPFCDEVIIGRNSIIDCTTWSHKLPKEVK